MAIQTVTNIDALLKEVYQGPVSDQLNSETRLLNLFKRQQVRPWEGRVIIEPIRTGRNEGVLATAEDGALPVAGRQTPNKWQIPIRFLHGRISITAQAIKHSRSNRGAFVRALEFELSGLVNDLADDRNRILAGYGSGILCLVNGDPGTGTTITTDAPGGVTGATNGTRFIQPNMEIAFIVPGGTTLRAGGTRIVASVTDSADFEITAAADAAVLDDDEVCRATSASGNTSAADIEPDGVLAIADDGTYVGTYHGIDRSATPLLQSTVLANVGAFSTDAVYRALHQADQVGNANIGCFLCGSDTLLEYIKLTEGDRRYMGSDLRAPDAGVRAAGLDWNKAVPFAGIPFKYDKDFAFGTLVGLDLRYLTRYVEVDGEWVDEDGAVLFRDANKDNFEARYRVWENFHTSKPNAHLRLDGITTTVPTFHVD
jgi:hypothetical protein